VKSISYWRIAGRFSRVTFVGTWKQREMNLETRTTHFVVLFFMLQGLLESICGGVMWGEWKSNENMKNIRKTQFKNSKRKTRRQKLSNEKLPLWWLWFTEDVPSTTMDSQVAWIECQGVLLLLSEEIAWNDQSVFWINSYILQYSL